MKEQTGGVLGSGFRHGQLWQQLDLFIDLLLFIHFTNNEESTAFKSFDTAGAKAERRGR